MEYNMRFGTWKVKSLNRLVFLGTVSKELAKYKLRFSGTAGGQMGGQWLQRIIAAVKMV
jgi:hypothetical protein